MAMISIGKCREDNNALPCKDHGYSFAIYPTEIQTTWKNPETGKISFRSPMQAKADTRTDAEVQDVVDKRSGLHYEPEQAKKEALKALDNLKKTATKDPNGGSQFFPVLYPENGAGFYDKHSFYPKFRPTPWQPNKTQPFNEGIVVEDHTAGPPWQRQTSHEYLRRQIRDWTTTFYGPSACDGCGQYNVVRSKTGTGSYVTSWEENEGTDGPSYTAHHCTHIRLFKSLAGKVLTVIDASLTANPKQHKAVIDLLKKAFAETISRAKELEGDSSAEALPREELA